jgi:hypothetical protein
MDAYFGRSEPGLPEYMNELTALHYHIGSVLLEHDGDWQRAATALEPAWRGAEPELRAALLLGFAWSSRNATIADTDTPAGLYAADLHRYAVEFTDGVEAFHGERFPLLPLPGPAGVLASSVAFDREDADISLRTALLLAAADGPNVFEGGDPAPGSLHIPTGPHPTNPDAPATVVMCFPLPDEAFPD